MVKSEINKPHWIGIQKLFDTDPGGEEVNPIGTYYVVTHESKTAAMILIRQEINPYLGGIVMFIHQVYVGKEYRRKGILKQMFKRVQEEASKNLDVKEIRLWVILFNFTYLFILCLNNLWYSTLQKIDPPKNFTLFLTFFLEYLKLSDYVPFSLF